MQKCAHGPLNTKNSKPGIAAAMPSTHSACRAQRTLDFLRRMALSRELTTGNLAPRLPILPEKQGALDGSNCVQNFYWPVGCPSCLGKQGALGVISENKGATRALPGAKVCPAAHFGSARPGLPERRAECMRPQGAAPRGCVPWGRPAALPPAQGPAGPAQNALTQLPWGEASTKKLTRKTSIEEDDKSEQHIAE